MIYGHILLSTYMKGRDTKQMKNVQFSKTFKLKLKELCVYLINHKCWNIENPKQYVLWPIKICTSKWTITYLLIQKDLRLFFLFFFYQLIYHHFHKFTFVTSRPSFAFFWFFVSTVSLITYVELDHRSLHFKYADYFVVGLCDLFSSER